jgi:transcriptional regulator with XRE-family HTH domain
MDWEMKPTYQIRVWQEDDWWLARVVAASEDADPMPLNALTQARSLARIESMGRDLVATILDAEEDAFGVDVEYVLPGEVGEVVRQTNAARAWLEGAQALWQERSAMAAKVLADAGYSLRETATLLGLSHQRVDQLLGGGTNQEQSKVVILCEGVTDARALQQIVSSARHEPLPDFVMLVANRDISWLISRSENMDSEFEDRVRTLVQKAAEQLSKNDHVA